jgi:hypothetical protein
MRFRALVSILAAIGVLLHAGLIVRHNSVMLELALQQPGHLPAQATIICHGDGQLILAGDDFSLPDQKPAQQQKTTSCPVCTGLLPVLALLASSTADIACPSTVPARYKAETSQFAIPGLAVHLPPNRGPPLSI